MDVSAITDSTRYTHKHETRRGRFKNRGTVTGRDVKAAIASKEAANRRHAEPVDSGIDIRPNGTVCIELGRKGADLYERA